MNSLTIAGHLGSDCGLRTTNNGTSVCSFSVPFNYGYGERKQTFWCKCAIFGKRAEALAQYLTKGISVCVTGEFHLEFWTTQEGEKRYSIEMDVRDITLLGGGQPRNEEEEQEMLPEDVPF